MLEALPQAGEALLGGETGGASHFADEESQERTGSKMSRLLYHREWVKKHPGYKTADSRLRALFRPAKRPFFREILGVKVRVNLLAGMLRYNAAQRLFNGGDE
jgi:hypothetical protein